MDTLYTLFRSVDNACELPLTPADAAKILATKKSHLAEEAKTNPLAREILRGGRIACEGFAPRHGAEFLAGPPTFFRTHELLRKTRSAGLPICIGGDEFPHNDAVALFARCVPNVRLEHAPWYSLSRYTTSLGLAWGSTLVVAHLLASGDGALPFDPGVLYHLGLGSTFLALLYTAFKHNRDVRHPAPWNTAIYLDLNTDFIRRDLPLAAAARKELIPRQRGLFKTPEYYYALARKIEAHGFDAEFARALAATPPGAPCL